MIKAIIVDDEEKSIEVLDMLLSTYFDGIQVVGKTSTGKDARTLIGEHEPDLVFLDVVMPGQTGFDLLADIDERKFEVIFCSGYDSYVIKAMRMAALDYLIKPVDVVELGEALKRVEVKIGEKERDQRFDQFIDNGTKKSIREHKIALPTSYGYKFVALKDIVRCEADSSYTRFHIDGEEPILVSKNLKEYEEMLNKEVFVRVHNSHLINLYHVSKYIKDEGGYIVMNDNSHVELSRRKKSEFLERLKAL